jgi:hypothetical protein
MLDAQLEKLREVGCTKIIREGDRRAPDRVLPRMPAASDAVPGENLATPGLYSDARKCGIDIGLTLLHGGGLLALPGATRTAKRGHGAASPDH